MFLPVTVACALGHRSAEAEESATAARERRPNVVFILADDLGYGDLGCYGQQIIQTPRLDRMAAEGMRFTQFYAGATVCAPSRCVLMVGQHTGHCHVRGNAPGNRRINQSLRAEDVTIAEIMHSAGYRTALIGKWGLGELDEPGHPLAKGFDYFFGYLNQGHAHNYYPEYLWRNLEKVRLRNEVVGVGGKRAGPVPDYGGGFTPGYAVKRIDYSHDLFAAEALQFVTDNRDRPFFLYLAFTIPHANNEGTRGTGNGAEVPDYGIYADKDWPDPDKGQAAMITRMDADVGRLLDRLRESSLAENTLVMFSSDNGPHREAGHDPRRFRPSGPLRGMKRDLYEGGIRVPFIAWWPGRIAPGTVSDHLGYFGDMMATLCELVGVPLPPDRDSVSFLPTLLGRPEEQKNHEYLYWEFYEQGSAQAVRFGNWKAVRKPMLTGPVELYDLGVDVGETRNVAEDHPAVVRQAADYMSEAHIPHPNWKVPDRK
ncbi:MAG: arylsulfatase [Thermogutta sp.]|nr:arylsulfatase [Thermogutta sp.]